MKVKGFTLIELLAVIVILAIIALIAIPMISKIIDKTEDSAVLRSAELYIDGVNQAIMRANLTNKIRPKECEIQEDGNLICDGEYEIKIEATGTKPNSGTLIIEDRTVKSFTEMILDIYKLEMSEEGKIVVIEKLNEFQDTMSDEEKLLNGAIPEVYDGLIPIVYSDNNWLVADLKTKWYDYSKQEWANAVILNSGVTKSIGDVIDVTSEIKGMFVWIPRYEYKIEGQYGTHIDGTLGTEDLPGEIEVNFISKETIIASSGYRIHPAFTFGTEQLNGIWVGKFETTGTDEVPTVLPGVSSLRRQNISAQFATAQEFNTYINNNSLDFHMAKNSEWGAAAYLSQSIYGKYGNSNYIGIEKQVIINNCSTFITGVGASSQNEDGSVSTCTTNTYETVKGQAASTTGNIYGIYDMSGGAPEYIMGVLNKTVGNSGISTWPNEKYYDNYITTSIATACDGICYGHALSETSGWYNDAAGFASSSSSWLLRGGSFSSTSNAGIFCLGPHNGVADNYYSFRVVLTKS